MNNVELMPREKIIKQQSQDLSDDELLAIILCTGTKDESVFELSNRLIKEYGLNMMFKMSYKDLISIKGIKDAKASKIMAIFEIARRANSMNTDIIIADSKSLYEYIKYEYLNLDTEVLTVVFVDANSKVLYKRKYKSYEVNRVEIPFRKIVGDAINYNCYGVYIVHNHPTGNPKPSESDLSVTSKLCKVLSIINIHLIDSLIIGNNCFYSINDELEKYVNNYKE